ncbi:MAG: hypothetical protein MI924_20560 [Chloroflexales bacterium]|nr:hypothetical protein [Chloroflexales bacterium]
MSDKPHMVSEQGPTTKTGRPFDSTARRRSDSNRQRRLQAVGRFHWRTFAFMFGALVLGAAWAAYNYYSTGGIRNDTVLRPLVWTIFAIPFGLFLGWLLARRSEWGQATFICFCLYFFSIFIAARIESLLVTTEQATAMGHALYFQTVMILQIIVGAGLAGWRALAPVPVENRPSES